MTFAAYPKSLTDKMWKKVESNGGVSSTGVGQWLRQAEQAYKTLSAGILALEKGDGAAQKVAPSKRAVSDSLVKASAALGTTLQKVKPGDKKKYLEKYKMFIENVAHELDGFDLNDHRGLKVPLDRYNERIPMWEKWIGPIK